MTDESVNIDGLEADELMTDREGIEVYRSGESVLLTTKAIREGEADAMLITFDNLQDLVVELREDFR